MVIAIMDIYIPKDEAITTATTLLGVMVDEAEEVIQADREEVGVVQVGEVLRFCKDRDPLLFVLSIHPRLDLWALVQSWQLVKVEKWFYFNDQNDSRYRLLVTTRKLQNIELFM